MYIRKEFIKERVVVNDSPCEVVENRGRKGKLIELLLGKGTSPANS